jgi:signal transduction histidine kinase
MRKSRSSKRNFRDFTSLSHRILSVANRGVSRMEFLREVSGMILLFSGCSTLELWLKGSQPGVCWKGRMGDPAGFSFDSVLLDGGGPEQGGVAGLGLKMLAGSVEPVSFYCKGGKFFFPHSGTPAGLPGLPAPGGTSYALLPFSSAEEVTGVMLVESGREDCFTGSGVEFFLGTAQTLGVAVSIRRTQAALKERLKELRCMYGICQVFNVPALPLKSVIRRVVSLLPPAMQFPGEASGRIVLDGRATRTPGFTGAGVALSSDLIVGDEKRGTVEVFYENTTPEMGREPFLREEQSLLDTVAKNLALIIERKQAEEEKKKLQKQLRHADRLATIGTLSAGVAHELNEPLGNILGFAQLARKADGLPSQTVQDLDKIITSSLHAREIVKKLLIFARQMPPKKTKVRLNPLVRDVLSFFEPQFAKGGIGQALSLDPRLPDIVADLSQVRQILVNLIVNAMQAMPRGGRLSITTACLDDRISLVIEDEGIGMTESVAKQIFLPFFTTKKVGQGTGLGLPVVHGIVTSHGGTIHVESVPGRGSRFEVILPVSGAKNDREDS